MVAVLPMHPPKGLRDRAMIAVLLGCGLRRSCAKMCRAAGAELEQIQLLLVTHQSDDGAISWDHAGLCACAERRHQATSSDLDKIFYESQGGYPASLARWTSSSIYSPRIGRRCALRYRSGRCGLVYALRPLAGSGKATVVKMFGIRNTPSGACSEVRSV